MTFITVTKVENRLCNVCQRVRVHGYIKEYRHYYCIRTHFIDPWVGHQFTEQMEVRRGITQHLRSSDEAKQ